MIKSDLLFAYGTLLDTHVQHQVFGRALQGEPDALTGYVKTAFAQGGHSYPDLRPAPEATVDGCVFALTAVDFQLADRYEGEPYIRVRVTLQSGREAWVYHTA